MYGTQNVHEFIYLAAMTSVSLASIIIKIGALIQMGALIGIKALNNKNTFARGRLFGSLLEGGC